MYPNKNPVGFGAAAVESAADSVVALTCGGVGDGLDGCVVERFLSV